MVFQYITEDYIKNYDKNSDTGHLLVVDVTYPKDLCEKHKQLAFFYEKHKIDKNTKLSCNFNDKNHDPVHICQLKQCIKSRIKVGKGPQCYQFFTKRMVKTIY